MKVKYIRRDIPEEISEEGGAYIQLVDKSTVGLAASIKEAINALYCVGEASLIEGYFMGLCRSVFAGIKADGCARCIGDIRFYPACGGQFDLDKGWDPLVNDVRIKAQLVNGVTLDVTDWTFEDATVGRVSFSVDNISDGVVSSRISTDKNVEINGKNFPTDIAVSWVCGTKSGTVAASTLTRTVSRLTIDKSAFSTLTAAESGLEIVFTLKGSYNKVTKSAIVNYVAPATPTFTQATSEGEAAGTVKNNTVVTITGTKLNEIAGETIVFKMPNEDEGLTSENASNISIAADGKSLTCSLASGATNLISGTGSVAVQGQAISVNFNFEL